MQVVQDLGLLDIIEEICALTHIFNCNKALSRDPILRVFFLFRASNVLEGLQYLFGLDYIIITLLSNCLGSLVIIIVRNNDKIAIHKCETLNFACISCQYSFAVRGFGGMGSHVVITFLLLYLCTGFSPSLVLTHIHQKGNN